jgi:prepilin-type N-terminal cleavage/methylation domain-containing protein
MSGAAMFYKLNNIRAFALIEVLIAVTIASIVVLSVYSGVSAGTLAISQNANLTRAIIIAKSKLNEFRLNGNRGTDLTHEDVKEYQGFTFSRVTERYENPLLMGIPATITTITVQWQDNRREKKYSIFTVNFSL